MKKYLLALFLVAFALNSCQQNLDVPEINKDNIYYGLTLNSAMLTHLGDADRDGESSYTLRLATIDANTTGEMATTRLLSLDLNFNLDEKGMIPEGEYSFGNLELQEGAYNNILSGSTFVNMESGSYETYAMWLINNGKIDIKHSAKEGEYVMTLDFEAKKLDKEVGIAAGKSKTIQCRYEGEVTIYGLPQNQIFTTYKPYYAYAVYYPLKGGQTYWDLNIVDANYYNVFMYGVAVGKEKYSAFRSQFQLISQDNGMTFPQGRFDLDNYGTLTNNTLMGAAITQIDVTEKTETNPATGEEVIYINQEESSYLDMISDGFVQITSRGGGNYDVSVEMYGYNGGYKCKLSNSQVAVFAGYTGADRNDVDYKFDQALMAYMGRYTYPNGTLSVPYWYLILYDSARKEFVQMGVNVELGSNFESGIPTGQYIVSEGGDANTVDLGFEDQNRTIYGSCIHDGESQYFDLITSGVLDVVNNGDGTYKFTLDMMGNNENYIKGTFEGAPTISDDTNSGSSGSVDSSVSERIIPMTTKAQRIHFGEGLRHGMHSIIGNNTTGIFGNYEFLK